MKIEVLPQQPSEQDVELFEFIEQRVFRSDVVRAAVQKGIDRARARRTVEADVWGYLDLDTA